MFIKWQKNDTSSGNEWQSMRTSDKIWQWVVISANFPFFPDYNEEPITRHPFSSFFFEKASSLHFFRVATSTQQLLFKSSYSFRSAAFFDELFFHISRFSTAVIFSYSYFIIAKLLWSSHLLRIGSCLGQYFVGSATILVVKLFQNKDIYSRATFSEQVLPKRKDVVRTDTFSTKVLLQKRCTFSNT